MYKLFHVFILKTRIKKKKKTLHDFELNWSALKYIGLAVVPAPVWISITGGENILYLFQENDDKINKKRKKKKNKQNFGT